MTKNNEAHKRKQIDKLLEIEERKKHIRHLKKRDNKFGYILFIFFFIH